jgi:hypothetical protein
MAKARLILNGKLAADPDAPPTPIHLAYRLGRHVVPHFVAQEATADAL